MSSFWEKLTKQKANVAKTSANVWQQLVADVLDEKETDADAVLVELERLGKSPADLESAVKLLRQRRAWAAELKDGEAAEVDLRDATEKLAKLERELEEFTERIQRKMEPVDAKRMNAIHRLNIATTARERLINTASDPALTQAARGVEAEMNALRNEITKSKRIQHAGQQLLDNMAAQENPELQQQVEGISQQLSKKKTVRDVFNERAAKLNSDSEAALQALLRPEAI